MTKHIFRSTETPTTSLKSGKIHNHTLWGLPSISRGIPKSRNGMERREVRISITMGDFNATGKDSMINWAVWSVAKSGVTRLTSDTFDIFRGNLLQSDILGTHANQMHPWMRRGGIANPETIGRESNAGEPNLWPRVLTTEWWSHCQRDTDELSGDM